MDNSAARLRIFLTATTNSTVFMSLYASEHKRPGDVDVLMIDERTMKKSQVQLVMQAATLNKYDEIIDFSRMKEETYSYVPSTSKQLTRNLKTKPVFKQVYNMLYRVMRFFKQREHVKKMKVRLSDYVGLKYETHIYQQPMLSISYSIEHLFPKAEINFLEHGIGDYMDFKDNYRKKGNFLCLYAEAFQRQFEDDVAMQNRIHALIGAQGFTNLAGTFSTTFPQIDKVMHVIPEGATVAILVLQPLNLFMIDPEFWPDFIDLSLKMIKKNDAPIFFLIKPHPTQEAATTRMVIDYFKAKNINHAIISDPDLTSMSLEILFCFWQKRVDYVFSPYSSSNFYLTRLYPESTAQYFYSMKSMEGFMSNCSQLYLRRRNRISALIKSVLIADNQEML